MASSLFNPLDLVLAILLGHLGLASSVEFGLGCHLALLLFAFGLSLLLGSVLPLGLAGPVLALHLLLDVLLLLSQMAPHLEHLLV